MGKEYGTILGKKHGKILREKHGNVLGQGYGEGLGEEYGKALGEEYGKALSEEYNKALGEEYGKGWGRRGSRAGMLRSVRKLRSTCAKSDRAGGARSEQAALVGIDLFCDILYALEAIRLLAGFLDFQRCNLGCNLPLISLARGVSHGAS